MELKTIKIFRFDELKPEIQKKVLKEHRNINTDFDWWSEVCEEEFHEKLKEAGIECENFSWDIYDRQFCMNKPDVTDKKKLMKATGCEVEVVSLSMTDRTAEISISISKSQRYRSDKNICEVEIFSNNDEVILDNDKIRDSIQEKINHFLLLLGEEFIKQLRTEYDYLLSDEAVKETLEANEYTFRQNGRVERG